MDMERFWRQTDLVVPEELPIVTVIGAGGIGSFTLLALAKMGVQTIRVFDHDRVETHNISNQLYASDDIGKYKVDAAQNICHLLTDVLIAPVPARFDKQYLARGVVVSGVDSMSARKEIWLSVLAQETVELYIEARMGAEVSRIYSVNPKDPEQRRFYEGTLYDDVDALPEPCTARAIIYNGFAIAALIASQVKKYSKKEELKKEIIFDLKTLTLLTQ